ncbi:MAG: hypothetical protein Q9219_000872 [cf. Caloplaca sp. 3 TL-2023]
MDASESKLPLHEDIMQLARLGEIGPIQKLFEEGKCKPNHTDAENITPLHWAAINNHYALCQFLIEQGADVNATGGESEATPAQWAVQRCHYYTVHLLLQHGADPTIADGQGYKMIHLATFDGNAFMLLIILLHPSVSIDEPDAQGHTALMWAAYNRLPTIVDLLLRFGAGINAVDETGFTPLHWALVRGSPQCIAKLLENGADRFAETSTNKTPAVVAEEMKTSRAWHRALQECDLEHLAAPAESKCNLLSDQLCNLVLRDPFTVVLAIWCTLQFIWMIMLLIVQSVQIARALTTYESMRSQSQRHLPATEAMASAITAGTTSMSGASLTNSGAGPDPAIPSGTSGDAPPRKEGCFAQWKRLLGLDTFIATATGKSGRRKRGNPFSRGVITNCRDFWFDPAPYFGQRENGAAMLNGEVINYTRMYETPSRMKLRRPRDQENGMYHSVDTEESV